jgi:hypothetical protein
MLCNRVSQSLVNKVRLKYFYRNWTELKSNRIRKFRNSVSRWSSSAGCRRSAIMEDIKEIKVDPMPNDSQFVKPLRMSFLQVSSRLE